MCEESARVWEEREQYRKDRQATLFTLSRRVRV